MLCAIEQRPPTLDLENYLTSRVIPIEEISVRRHRSTPEQRTHPHRLWQRPQIRSISFAWTCNVSPMKPPVFSGPVCGYTEFFIDPSDAEALHAAHATIGEANYARIGNQLRMAAFDACIWTGHSFKYIAVFVRNGVAVEVEDVLFVEQLGRSSANPHDGRSAKHDHYKSSRPLKQRGTGRRFVWADFGRNKEPHQFIMRPKYVLRLPRSGLSNDGSL